MGGARAGRRGPGNEARKRIVNFLRVPWPPGLGASARSPLVCSAPPAAPGAQHRSLRDVEPHTRRQAHLGLLEQVREQHLAAAPAAGPGGPAARATVQHRLRARARAAGQQRGGRSRDASAGDRRRERQRSAVHTSLEEGRGQVHVTVGIAAHNRYACTTCTCSQ